MSKRTENRIEKALESAWDIAAERGDHKTLARLRRAFETNGLDPKNAPVIVRGLTPRQTERLEWVESLETPTAVEIGTTFAIFFDRESILDAISLLDGVDWEGETLMDSDVEPGDFHREEFALKSAKKSVALLRGRLARAARA